MSLVSQQQILQNQLQLKQLDEQRQKQAEQTKSFQSNRSSTQEVLQSIQSKQLVENKKKVLKNDPSDPLSVQIPTNANPTDILAARFNSWRNIIGCLSHYLKEIVSVHEEISRQQIRLHHAITFPFLTQGLDGEFYQPMRVTNSTTSTVSNTIFHSNSNSNSKDDSIDLSKQNNEFDLARKFFLPLGSGSIQDLPTILYQYHSNAALLAQSTVKELNTTIIPRLEDLKRDLLIKIKEIKSLQSDFKNQVDKYKLDLKQSLSNYIQSIEIAKNNPLNLDPKNDPYLLKTSLDKLIKKKLTEENYLHEAFINLQTSGKELEKVVYTEVQTALTVYAKLLGQQAQNVFDGLISKLDSSILTKDPSFEWESFVSKDKIDFIDLNTPMRRSSEIFYKYQNDPLTFEIKLGYLERKSKYLKSYAKGYYVLTPSFFHEFKSSDRKKDPIPVMSLSLSDCTVAEHSRKDEKNPNSYHKFVLHNSQNGGLLHKGHNWVFRADTYDIMMSWYNDIKRLTQLSKPELRAAIAFERRKNKRINSLNNSPSISSIPKGRRHTQLSNITDRSNFAASDDLTNQSLNTVLSMPKDSNSILPPSSELNIVPEDMVTNDVVVVPSVTSVTRDNLYPTDKQKEESQHGHQSQSQQNQQEQSFQQPVLQQTPQMQQLQLQSRLSSLQLQSPPQSLSQQTQQLQPVLQSQQPQLPNIDLMSIGGGQMPDSLSIQQQQQLLSQQQQILEQKQQLLLQQQQLQQQQRAFSMNSQQLSSVPRSFSLNSQQQQQQQHQHTLSLNSSKMINGSKSTNNDGAYYSMNSENTQNIDNLGEKVAQLSLSDEKETQM